MSFFGVPATKGEMKWIIGVDDRKASIGIASFKKQVKDLDTTVKGTSKSMGTTMTQEFKKIDTQTKSLGQKMTGLGSSFSTVGIGMSATMTSAIQLQRSYRDLVDTQIAVDRTALKMSRTQEAASKAQIKLNDLQKKGIKSGIEYEQALVDVQQTTDAATLAITMHDEALEAQGDTYQNFAMSIVPTVIGSVSTMGAAIKGLGLNTQKLTGFFKGLGGQLAIAGVGVAATGVVIASYIADIKRTEGLHAVFDAHVRDWNNVRDSIKNAIDAIEADPVALAIKTISGSLGELRKELVFAENLADVGPLVDKILFGKEIGMVSPDTRKMIQSRLDFIKRALLNPKNFQDEFFTKTTLTTFQQVFDDIGRIINQTRPEWQKAAQDVAALNKLLVEQNKVIDAGINLWAETKFALSDWRKEFAETMLITSGDAGLTSGKEIGQGMSTGLKAMEGTINTTTSGIISSLVNQSAADLKAREPEFDKAIEDFMGIDPATMDKVMNNWQQMVFTLTDTWKTKLANMEFPLLQSAFGIDIDKDKITKKILDYIPDEITKKLKINLKEGLTFKQSKESIMETLWAGIGDADMPDEEFDQMVKGVMKLLAEKFPGNPWAEDMRRKLAGTIGSKDTEGEVAKLLAEWEAAPIPVTFTPEDLDKLSTAIALGIAGIPVDVIPIFPEGGFNFPDSVEVPAIANFKSRFGGAKSVQELGENAAAAMNAIGISPITVPATASISNVVFQDNTKIPFIESSADDSPNQLAINATAKVTLDLTDAEEGIKTVSKWITDLTSILPRINLQTDDADKAIHVTSKWITDLTTIEPQINLQKDQASKVIGAVRKEIMNLETLDPHVKVKVSFSGSGKISGSASGSIKIAQQGMHEILTEDVLIYAHAGEAVHIDRASGGYNSSSIGGGGGHPGSTDGGTPIIVEVHNHHDTFSEIKMLKKKLGSGRSVFG